MHLTKMAQRVELIVVSPETDDTEPTWSPANPNQLAFTAKHRRLPTDLDHHLFR